MSSSHYSSTSLSILQDHLERLSKTGTWEVDFRSNGLFWSEGVFRMLGYEPNEIEVKFETGVNVLHPEDRARALEHMNDALAGKVEYNIQKRLIRKDGTFIHVVSKASIIKDETGNPIQMIGVFQDVTEFQKTRQNLEQAKMRTEALLETLDGIFWEADAETFEFSYVSPQVEKITGYTQSDWIGTPDFWKNHIHPEERDQMVNFCHSETVSMRDHIFDYRFRKKDGSYIWLNDRVKVIIKDGKPFKLSGLMIDISHEKALSQALKDETLLNQSLVQQLPSVFFLFDEQGKFLVWNKKLEELSGYTAMEIKELKPQDFFAKEYHEMIFEQIENVFTKNEGRGIELEVLHKTGRKIPVLVSATPIKYQSKYCVFGAGLDISDLVESKKALAESNQRYEILSRATNDAIWDFDTIQGELFWAEGFHSLFGYDLSVVQPSLDLLVSKIHPEDRGRIFLKIQDYMNPANDQVNWLEEYRFQKADGTFAFVIDKAVFVRDNTGAVTRVVGAMQDITERKAYETSLTNLNAKLEKHVRELALSNLELEQFAFVASHDLQEPLRMISSFLMLLSTKYSGQLDDKAQKYIAFARDGAKRMQQIILDLLELSRVGKASEEAVLVNTSTIVNEVEANFKKFIHEKKAKLIYPTLPVVTSHRLPLMQIFQNLIGNSLKYSKPDVEPVITIGAEECPREWVFYVKDNGIGIEEEFFEKIFVVFQRLHRAEEFEGTGIGLAIVKKAIDFLQGKVWVESKLGEGSTFYFSLPK